MLQTTAFRRHFTRWLIAFALAVPLTTVYASRTAVTALSAAIPAGATLSVLASPVEVASADPGSFGAAIDGQTLYQGDTIRTGPTGMALLTFFDGSESQLDSGSQLQIEQMDASPAPQIAFLQTAGVTVNHVIPMPAQGSFRTDTQAATGLVRGTSYVVIVGPAGTCGLSGDQPCVASVILLTDRNGHVGRVDVTANDSNAGAVQLSIAGAAVAATSHTATAAQVDPAALAQLEAVAHVRDDPAAFVTTEQDVRAIAATLEPLVSGVAPPTSAAPVGLPQVAPETSSVPLAEAEHVVTQAPAPASSPPIQTPGELNAPTTAATHPDHVAQTSSGSAQTSSGSGQGSSGSAQASSSSGQGSSSSGQGSSSSGQGNAGAAHPVSVSAPAAVTAPASPATNGSPPPHGDSEPAPSPKVAAPTGVTKIAAADAAGKSNAASSGSSANAASPADSANAGGPGKSDTATKSADSGNAGSTSKSTQADKSNAPGKSDKSNKSDG